MACGCLNFINNDCLWWIILIVAVLAILSDDGCDSCGCGNNNSGCGCGC